MLDNSKYFLVDLNEGIVTVSLNRPTKSNALNLDMWWEMKSIFEELAKDDNLKVVLLTADGKNFSAGMDLSSFGEIPKLIADPDPIIAEQNLKAFIQRLQSSISAIEACPVPVIGVVHGACIGGGINILAACDLRYCSADAYFSIKEVDLGIIADLGAIQRLPASIGLNTIAEWSYTGRKIFSEEAKTTGLVNAVYEDQIKLNAETQALAKQIATKTPSAIRGLKQLIMQQRDMSITQSLEVIAQHNAKLFLNLPVFKN